MIENISEKIKTKGEIRKIVVDRDQCIGAKSCIAAAPGVFELDQKDLAYIVDPNAANDDTVLLAAQSCPVMAILLYDKKGDKIFPKI